VYIASLTGETGKSTVALGILELLVRRLGRVGVFRPIVRPGSQRDYVLELLLAHDSANLSYDACAGVTYEDVHADRDAALTTIIERYHAVAEQCDAVVVVGSDYTDVSTPTEFSFNGRIAANLGVPVVLVLNGRERSPNELSKIADIANAELIANYGKLAAIIANRCDAGELKPIRDALATSVPVAALPEVPLLSAPTVNDLVNSGHVTPYRALPAALGREILTYVIGGMTLPHLLDRLSDDALVITPADRHDIVAGLLLAETSRAFPKLAGIVLNGGFPLPPQIERLLQEAPANVPILTTPGDTFQTATRLAGVRGRLTKSATRKVETALALFEENVDTTALLDQLDVSRSDVVTPLMFEHGLISRARADRKHIVLPEGSDERVLTAAAEVLERGVADVTLLGSTQQIRTHADALGINVDEATIVDPLRAEDLRERFAAEYAKRRAHKGVTLEMARDQVVDVSYFGTMMVLLGLADGMVSGAVHTTAHTIRPAFEVVKTEPGVSVVSGVFFMCLRDRVLVYGDCAVNPDPTAEQLADIAITSATTATQFDIDPRIAMLSYSTGESGAGADVDKVRAATALVREQRPDLSAAGPIQYDAAVDVSVAQTKMPGNDVAGRATVFIFPDLNTGNNTYKAVQRSAGAVAVGPVLQGLRKPVNDLSRGATVRDIVNTIAITAIQAQ
jgi:phosphate acetyltransferase